MSAVRFCDPPQGWAYGFPKEMPHEFPNQTAFHDWLVSEGYPQSIIDNYGDSFYCRFWSVEE